MFVLDTNVVSEMRKARSKQAGRAKISPHVEAWVGSVSASSLYLSVITVLELEMGVLLMERRDSSRGSVLRLWIENHVMPAFEGRVLPVDLAVARRCAAFQVPNPMDNRDALIAATASVHGFTVVTRNISHFKDTGVPLLNPW